MLARSLRRRLDTHHFKSWSAVDTVPFGFAHQEMNMFWHHHISHEMEFAAMADSREFGNKCVWGGCRL